MWRAIFFLEKRLLGKRKRSIMFFDDGIGDIFYVGGDGAERMEYIFMEFVLEPLFYEHIRNTHRCNPVFYVHYCGFLKPRKKVWPGEVRLNSGEYRFPEFMIVHGVQKLLNRVH